MKSLRSVDIGQRNELINKGYGVTISLRMVGQGHTTPIHTPNLTPYTNIQKKYPKHSFLRFSTRSSQTDGQANRPKDQWTDGPTDGHSLL